jgi:hypothetical protein
MRSFVFAILKSLIRIIGKSRSRQAQLMPDKLNYEPMNRG